MALSTFIKHFADGTLTIEDGTGTPLSITVQFDEGDFSISGLKATMRETTPYETRGQLRTVRHTNRIFPTFSFSAQAAEFSEDSTGTLADAILKNGTVWSAAVSTLGANAEVDTRKVTIAVEGTDFGDAADGTFSLDDCELSIDWSEGQPNKFVVNGTVYGDITGDMAVVTP